MYARLVYISRTSVRPFKYNSTPTRQFVYRKSRAPPLLLRNERKYMLHAFLWPFADVLVGQSVSTTGHSSNNVFEISSPEPATKITYKTRTATETCRRFGLFRSTFLCSKIPNKLSRRFPRPHSLRRRA